MTRPGIALAGLLLAAALPAAADEPARPAPRLYLTGRATIESQPDYATVSVGVTNRAPTPSAAIDATSATAARIIAAVKAAGIEARDVQTSNLSLAAVYRTARNPDGTQEQRPDGYGASNTVSVRIRDLGRIGIVLRSLVEGGGTTIGDLAFELADPARAERAALAAAIRDARAQAETIANAAGVKLGRIEEIRHGAPEPAYIPRRARTLAAAAPPPPVPVEAGTLTVATEISVVFAIEQP